MIRTPELAVECINQAKSNTNLPVSVKTRLGFTYVDEYKEWLSLLLKQELAALTVHLRTRKEMSKVDAHFELIPEIIKLRDEIAPETKLIINGDIKNRQHALELHEKYPAVDGFMIGRGVFINPFCFTDKTPTKEELLNLFRFHLDKFDEHSKEVERYPYEPLKHFFKVYINSFDGASDLRVKLMDCKTTEELREVLAELEA
jgi:tRNA-dihydrouridine synthase